MNLREPEWFQSCAQPRTSALLTCHKLPLVPRSSDNKQPSQMFHCVCLCCGMTYSPQYLTLPSSRRISRLFSPLACAGRRGTPAVCVISCRSDCVQTDFVRPALLACKRPRAVRPINIDRSNGTYEPHNHEGETEYDKQE